MSHGNFLCATSTSGTQVGGVWEYPAEHCLFHQPGTIMSDTQLDPETPLGCDGQGFCEDAFLDEEEWPPYRHNPRPGRAGFGAGSMRHEQGMPNGRLDPGVTEPEVVGDDVFFLYCQDFRTLAADGRFIPIRVFWVLFRAPGQPWPQPRGIGRELAREAADEPILDIYHWGGARYADMVIAEPRQEGLPIDVLTVSELPRPAAD
ncbi:hypothetical protein [Tautonia sociabilis]|uniref:Uncharacterized protein n=1 Tax=Tautonia sociabilis TaxID=2080755 RepID=A0A432MPN5_9BACT|nr:hypothetical protein [Tautonia sociabilis]RUL89056.1 hypothetical protein TsocGM_04165 [Tautonia sociabilis]